MDLSAGVVAAVSPARTAGGSCAAAEPLTVLLLGPTGSGKTALSLELAQHYGGEIVSCDSVAVYRGMDLGTAKPTKEERARLPHHLIDVTDPDQPFTAGEYSRQARVALREISARGHLPIVTGGTGLYLRALTEGLFAGPERQPELRARLERSRAKHEKQSGSSRQVTPAMNTANLLTRYHREAVANSLNDLPNLPHSSKEWQMLSSNHLVQSETWLHRLLHRLDPASAARIHSNDAAKLIRAIEVCLAARKPLSEVLARDPLTGFRVLRIGLNPPRQALPPREDLYDRLNRRCAAMFASGIVEETRSLLERYGPVKALDSLGYRQALAVLAGTLSVEEAVAAAQQGHRNYAKRQLTWFRREPEVHWIAGFGDEPETLRAAIELIQNKW
ncbi:MAG: tRNA (adenosine(37)-N6)-dimethylallyltransferase MiaA [Terracidiphilus sp.]|jgi:tRNA dimethylallyltransferase